MFSNTNLATNWMNIPIFRIIYRKYYKKKDILTKNLLQFSKHGSKWIQTNLLQIVNIQTVIPSTSEPFHKYFKSLKFHIMYKGSDNTFTPFQKNVHSIIFLRPQIKPRKMISATSFNMTNPIKYFPGTTHLI